MHPVDAEVVDAVDADDAKPVHASRVERVEYENRIYRIGGPRWWWAVVQVSLATALMATLLLASVIVMTFAFGEGEYGPALLAAVALACFIYPTWRLYRVGLPVLLRTSDRLA